MPPSEIILGRGEDAVKCVIFRGSARRRGRDVGNALACVAVRENSDRHLSLWKKRLGTVPDWVWERTDLETLVLAENELCEVSERIGCMKSLRMLDLGHNNLTHLPDTISQLDALTDFLYLHDNKLTSLPACFDRLTKLRYLNISQNTFEALPPCIFGMHNLVELRASDNRLNAVPDSVERVSRLRELHLRNNVLKTLPDSIASLHELRVIDLRGNPITTLPKSLATMPRLEKLDLRWISSFSLPEWIGDLEDRSCLVYR